MQTTEEKLNDIADGVAIARRLLKQAGIKQAKLDAESKDLASMPAECQEGTTLAVTKARIQARVIKLKSEIAADLGDAADFAEGLSHLVDGEFVPKALGSSDGLETLPCHLEPTREQDKIIA